MTISEAFSPTPPVLRRWAVAGLLFSCFQCAVLVGQYVSTQQSPGILVCLIVCVLFTLGQMRYVRRLAHANPSPTDKYFLIGHVLIATFYVWCALTTYLLHLAGIEVMAALFDDDSSNDFSHAARAVLSVMFIVTVLSLVNDAYATRFHAHHLWLRTSSSGGLAHGSSDRPRGSAVLAAGVDVVLVVLCGVSFSIQGDYGSIVLVLLAALSLALEARYAATAWMVSAIDTEWHSVSQLLALQHALFTSTILLVNMLLLLLHSMGTSLPEIVANDTTGEGAQIVASVLAYVGILASTVVQVGLHTSLDAHAQAYNGHAFGGAGNRGGYDALSAAVPVPPSYAHGGEPVYAVAVPLDHESAV